MSQFNNAPRQFPASPTSPGFPSGPVMPQTPGFPQAPPPPHPIGMPQIDTGYHPPTSFPQPHLNVGFDPLRVTYLGATCLRPGALPSRECFPGYVPDGDFDALRAATKGMGSKKDKIVTILAPLEPMKMAVLQHAFTTKIGKQLGPLLDSELSSMVGTTTDLQQLVHGLVLGPLFCDAWIVSECLKGLGTREDLLNEVLLGRSNEDIQLLAQAYPSVAGGRQLLADVQGDLSGKTARLFTMALAASRETGLVVNDAEVQKDVDELYKAGQGKAGTDEIAFCRILTGRSPQHLGQVEERYSRQHKSLTKIIKAEFSGHMQSALLHIVKGVKHKRASFGEGVWRDVKYLEKAMKGRGTDDFALICRTLRASWNPQRMQQIKHAYKSRYSKYLDERVKKETSGDYRTLLVALIAKGGL
ncbi:Annexin [Cylindrobasidium torrendii FP15055 ss-10]|uniref:Annexin n=1 Tax=Cylindrobasidium torrendii FP15055 ss-10 TaxID=1314674 RepID=A0A0D7BUA4_9AGAR|nr:Annexin [Cylindrobasidium torrendii FP15055 ss-10]